jgi:hypothetical protein
LGKSSRAGRLKNPVCGKKTCTARLLEGLLECYIPVGFFDRVFHSSLDELPAVDAQLPAFIIHLLHHFALGAAADGVVFIRVFAGVIRFSPGLLAGFWFRFLWLGFRLLGSAFRWCLGRLAAVLLFFFRHNPVFYSFFQI